MKVVFTPETEFETRCLLKSRAMLSVLWRLSEEMFRVQDHPEIPGPWERAGGTRDDGASATSYWLARLAVLADDAGVDIHDDEDGMS